MERIIHENFLYVINLARKLKKNKKKPTLLFKLDIEKAFDSVYLDYLMDMFQQLGLPSKFRDSILLLFLPHFEGAPKWYCR
jgi:hypothetical protein